MLQINLLGTFHASLNGNPIHEFESAKVRALLAYLTVNMDRPHSREKLAGLFWAEKSDETASKNLRQALSNLRKAIHDEDSENPTLLITSTGIQANPAGNIWLDVNEFDKLIFAAQSHPHRHANACSSCAGKLKNALSLYAGEFMQGFFIKEADAFHDWITTRQENVHQKAVEVVQQLLQYHEQYNETKSAITLARRLVELDPWLEDSHSTLMELLARDGQRNAALKQFETCRRILEKELGVTPQEETILLHEQIRSGNLPEKRLHTIPNNLSVEITSFIGRNAELEQLADYLQRRDYRLITLVGSGGVGKTRIALQSARDARFSYPNGVFLVNLSGVNSSAFLPFAIAEAVGFLFSSGKDQQTQLIDFLRQKELLLALDNFEHLLDGAELIADILQQAPRVTILATSREPLRLQAEWLLHVDGLPASLSDIEPAAVKSDALRLFDDRACHVAPSFDLDATLEDTAKLCQLLDGLPLGIELAAATVQRFSPLQIYEQVLQNMDFLSSQFRDVPERHRSLRAVFEHSWNLLTSKERIILSKLSVFRGGFTLKAAEVIVGAKLDTLIKLTEKSLLQSEEQNRFHLHEIVRQFTEEKLAGRPREDDAARESHSQYFLQFLHDDEHLLRIANRAILDACAVEMDNIRAAWTWGYSHRRADLIDLGAEGLMYFYDARNWYNESKAVFREAAESLNPAGKTGATSSPEEMRAFGKVVGFAGWTSQRLGAFDQARLQIEQSLRIAHFLEEDELIRKWERRLGYICYMQADYDEAIQHTQIALNEARRVNDLLDIQDCLNNLALVANQKGEYEKAKEALTELLDLSEKQDAQANVFGRINLGLAHYYLGEYNAARRHSEGAIAIAEAIENRHALALAVTNLGIIEKTEGNFIQAVELFKRAHEIQTEIGNRLGIASNLSNLGSTLNAMQEYERAQEHHLQALDILRAINHRWGVTLSLNNLAGNALMLKDFDSVRGYLQEGLPLSLDISVPPLTINGLLIAGELLQHKGNHRKAAELAAFSLEYPDPDSENIEEGEKLWKVLQKALPEKELAKIRQNAKEHAKKEGALTIITEQVLKSI